MKKKYNLKHLLVLVCCLTILGCGKSNETPEQQLPAVAVPGKLQTNLDQVLILKLVNIVRSVGCDCKNKETGEITHMPEVPAVTWSDDLAAIAIAHSDDMETKKYFSHTNPDGKSAGVRLTEANYKWLTYSENIASGQKTEQEVVKSWLDSEGHCKNIMNSQVVEMGVARTKTNKWTQLFGKRK